MEFHNQQVALACRVCGKRLKKAKGKQQSYECVQYSRDLEETFGIDVSNDKPNIHPVKFCLPCRLVISRSKRARETGGTYVTRSLQNVFQWCVHKEDCSVCQHYFTLVRGGGQNKKVLGVHGRPTEQSPASVLSLLRSLAAPSYFPTGTPTYTNRDSIHPECICVICMEVLERPVELQCGSMVCFTCCCRWVEISLSVNCPCCHSHPLHDGHISAPSRVTMNFLGSLMVNCERGCNKSIRAQEYSLHIQSSCRCGSYQSTLSPSKTTIKEILQKPVDTPTTPAEKRVAENLIRRLMSESTGKVVKVTTQGLPLSLVPVTTCKVKSSEASPKTLKRRCAQLSGIREVISGGDSRSQLTSELKLLSQQERQEVLQTASLPIVIPPDHGLAMKANLALPWAKLRVVRRWLKSLNITLASEQKQRALMKSVIGDNLTAEMGAFTFRNDSGCDEIREAVFAYVPNLVAQVADFIALHERSTDGLTWHGVMPPDELWVKLGGDKGRGSFKLNMQLANIKHPNSQKHTCLLSMFMAGDSTTNLHTCIDMYHEQVSEIQGMPLGSRRIRVFLSGDYEFLCAMYGLSGASGRHNCLWCTITSSDLQKPLSVRGKSSPRSLEMLKSDYNRLLAEKGGNTKFAKMYNNVIGLPLLDIPLDQVCFPGLHLSLGIFNRLWTLLEEACTEMDLLLAKESTPGTFAAGFNKHLIALRDLSDIRSRLKMQERHAAALHQLVTYLALNLPDPETDETLMSMREQASVEDKILSDLKSKLKATEQVLAKAFKAKDGPYYKSLHNSLQTLNIQRQAYQGGTFVGNHVNKVLKPASKDDPKLPCVEVLLGSLTSLSLNHSPALQTKVKNVTPVFKEALTLFGKCHRRYSGNVMDDDAIAQLEKDISSFLQFYRRNFPKATILPKMHILEDHVIPWMQKWRVGAGLMGEQGAESLHSHIHSLEDNYRGIVNRVDRLKYIFKEYMLETCPTLQSVEPPIKRRKKKDT